MRYRTIRRVTDFPAVILSDGERHSVEIRDVSDGGLKVAGLPAPSSNEKVTLCLRGEKLPCVVKWTINDLTGLQFAAQVPLPLRSLIGRNISLNRHR